MALCLAMIVIFGSFTNAEWELIKNEDGIKVYTRMAAHTSIKELKINTTVHCSLAAVVSLLSDVNSYNDWVYNCKDAKIIKHISNNEMYRYQVTKAPWPVSDRDLITHTLIRQDAAKTVTITGEAMPNYLAINKNLVRVHLMEERWVLTPMKGGNIDVLYELKTEPGGAVPNSILNMFIVDGPLQSIKNFRAYVHHAKYENAKLNFIKEL